MIDLQSDRRLTRRPVITGLLGNFKKQFKILVPYRHTFRANKCSKETQEGEILQRSGISEGFGTYEVLRRLLLGRSHRRLGRFEEKGNPGQIVSYLLISSRV